MPPLLESFRRELIRRNIPWQYVERATAELADHHDDLEAEIAAANENGASAAERLGDPVRLAASHALQYRARSFAGRHPVWAFVIGPLPLALLLYIGSVLFAMIGFVLIDWLVGIEGKTVSELAPLTIWSMLSAHYASALAPFAAAAILLSRWAYWSGCGWRWALVSVVIVAIAAASYQSTLTLPQEPGGGKWAVGFGLGLQLSASQWFQFACTLLVGAYCMWRLQRKQGATLAAA